MFMYKVICLGKSITENKNHNNKQESISRVVPMGESPLLDLLPHKVCHHDRLHSRVSKNPPIPLFPTAPHGVDERPARLPPLLLRYPGEHAIPPSINAVSQNWWRHPNGALPTEDVLSHLLRETAFEKKVMHCFGMASAKLANGVMWPTSNRQIVRGEDLAVQHQPSKENDCMSW